MNCESQDSAARARVCASAGETKQSRPRAVRPTAPPDALGFTVRDACRLGGFGRTTLYGLVKAGRLDLVRVGGRTLVVGDSLRALLRAAA